ncbi:hypothetical protein MASR2M66_19600 [Chloroflexota bacterium]
METTQTVTNQKAGSSKKWILIGGAALALICLCLVIIGALVIPPLLKAASNGSSNYSGIASEQLKFDVLTAISKAEGCPTVSLNSGQMMMRPEQSSDGSWNEIWRVSVCGESRLYSITFTPDGVGGTYFSVNRTDQ